MVGQSWGSKAGISLADCHSLPRTPALKAVPKQYRHHLQRYYAAMSGIHSLPLEIWLALSDKLLLCDFWSLLACGNRLLNNRLRQHDLVTHLRLDCTNKRQFASFLAHGRLDKVFDLSFWRVSYATAQEMLKDPTLRSRFTHLQSLEFDSMPCWIDMLMPSGPLWSEVFSTDDTINIALLMPSLTHFYFYARTQIANGPSLYDRYELPLLNLPETLKSLEVHNLAVPSILQIPPHLTTLHILKSKILSRATVAQLPKTLTSLESGFTSDFVNRLLTVASTDARAFQTAEYLVEPWISRTTLRDLLDCDDPEWPSTVPLEHLEALKKLHASRFEGWGCLRQLPLLTHLGVTEIGWSEDVVLDVLLLPKTLKSLLLGRFITFPPSPVYAASWPPNITALTVSMVHKLDVDDMPSSIVHLETLEYALESSPITTCGHQASLDKDSSTVIAAHKWFQGLTDLPHWSNCFHNGLTTLKVFKSSLPLSLHEIGLLPRTLTHLEWTKLQFEKGDYERAAAQFSCVLRHPGIDINMILPTRLEASENFENEGLERHIPLSTQSSPLASPSSLPSSLPQLWPLHLKTFIAGGYEPDEYDRVMPSTAESSPSDFLLFLPSTLTHYRFHEIDFDERIYASLAKLAHLGKLSLNKVSRRIIATEAKRLWQVSEDRFFEAWIPPFRGELVKYLFPFAEEIDIADIYISSDEFQGFQRLRAVTCEDGGYCNISNARFLWQFLPPTLTYLQLNSKGLNLTEEFIIDMPSNIVKLKLSQLPFTLISVATMFPRGTYGSELNEATLKDACDDLLATIYDKVEIKIVTIDISLTPTDTLQVLPSTILSIDLPTDTKNEHFYRILPSSLKSLRLSRSTNFSDAIIPLLPASLLHLQINEDMSISNDAIKLLPQLTTLKLRSNSRLTSDCIPFLPSTLTCLDLHAALFTDTHIDRLPTGLTDLDISWSSISQEALPLLPQGLVSLNIENNRLLNDGDPSPLPAGLKHLRAPQGMLKRIIKEERPDLEASSDTSFAMQSIFD